MDVNQLVSYRFLIIKPDKTTMPFPANRYLNIFRRATASKRSAMDSDTSTTSTEIILQTRSDDSIISMKSITRRVHFHPSVVTVVLERPPTSIEDKCNLYFSRQELEQYRSEEKSLMFEKDRIISILQSQEKYQKSKGFQHGNVTKVRFQAVSVTPFIP